MKRLTTFALLACVCLPGVGDEKSELLKNGSFETVEANEVPAGWLYATPNGETAEFKVIQDKPKEGKNCLRIKGAVTWAAAVSAAPVEIDRSKTYILTGWLRVHRGQGAIKFDYFQGDQHLGQTLPELMGPTAEWKQMTVRSETPSYPTATHLVVTVAGLGDTECDFDAIALKAE